MDRDKRPGHEDRFGKTAICVSNKRINPLWTRALLICLIFDAKLDVCCVFYFVVVNSWWPVQFSRGSRLIRLYLVCFRGFPDVVMLHLSVSIWCFSWKRWSGFSHVTHRNCSSAVSLGQFYTHQTGWTVFSQIWMTIVQNNWHSQEHPGAFEFDCGQSGVGQRRFRSGLLSAQSGWKKKKRWVTQLSDEYIIQMSKS